MTSIYDFINYREYLQKWIEDLGPRGYGVKGRIAAALNISSSLVSQIFKAEKTLTPDQASDLCDFMGLVETEADYFHLLLDFDRASSHKFKEKLKKKIIQRQEHSRKISQRVPKNRVLSDEDKAIYYSSWLYTGMRNLTAVPGMDHAESIAKHLNIEVSLIHRILRFLLDKGMCKEENGKITYGPSYIYIDKDSPFINKHHQNWRFQAIQNMEKRRDGDIFFTSPMSLSHEAAEEIRKLIPNIVEKAMKISGPSDSETVACLNIDWFKY